MRSGPDQCGLLPRTMTSLLSTSTPEEMLARDDRIEKSLSSELSLKPSGFSSPSARATPNVPAARAKAMDLFESDVRTVLPALAAAWARATVTQGHFTWTKCT